MIKKDRLDLYFSYWVMFWAILSIIFKTCTFPIIFVIITFIIQYIYTCNNICKIINTKYYYVLFGNFTIVNIKYLLILYGILFRFDNYNIYTELLIGTILFIIFNIYYFIIVQKIYYLFTPNDKNIFLTIDKGPCVYFYKMLLNGK